MKAGRVRTAAQPFRKGAIDMGTTKWILGLAFLVCLLWSPLCGPRTYAQQNNAAATANQEFIDSIKTGDLAKVRELLKQDPALIKATSKNGASAIQVAVYVRQKPITDLLLATGVELNISHSRVLTGWVDAF